MDEKLALAATILVVDDLQANRMVLERQLERLGHRVVLAEHGLEAIELLHKQQFDLIMLDIMMPVMNGFETLTVLKSDQTLRHIPVVVVSALNDLESIARCITLGAEDFLFKPVERVLLEARVEACLVRKQLHDREVAALAAAEAANKAKGAFVSMVSHELKNPITGIAGYSDMLLNESIGPLNDLQSESVRAIRNLTRLMVSLLGDLSDLTALESGHLRLKLEPWQLHPAVASAVEAVQKLMADKQHSLSVSIPPDLPMVKADGMRLVQILTNLLSNAGKYTQAGGEIRLGARYLDAGLIEVAVSDSGIGIPAGVQARIFEPFFRTVDARTGGEPGTGLGLSITRQLVELQGGQIWFTSAPGEGTTFSFTLPTVSAGAQSVGLDTSVGTRSSGTL